MLMTMDCSKIISFQLIKENLSTNIFKNFLFQTIRYLREVENEKRLIIVFLDNASYHKTNEIKLIGNNLKIVLLFNTPNNPQSNPIENLFEYLKRDLRKRTFLHK